MARELPRAVADFNNSLFIIADEVSKMFEWTKSLAAGKDASFSISSLLNESQRFELWVVNSRLRESRHGGIFETYFEHMPTLEGFAWDLLHKLKDDLEIVEASLDDQQAGASENENVELEAAGVLDFDDDSSSYNLEDEDFESYQTESIAQIALDNAKETINSLYRLTSRVRCPLDDTEDPKVNMSTGDGKTVDAGLDDPVKQSASKQASGIIKTEHDDAREQDTSLASVTTSRSSFSNPSSSSVPSSSRFYAESMSSYMPSIISSRPRYRAETSHSSSPNLARSSNMPSRPRPQPEAQPEAPQSSSRTSTTTPSSSGRGAAALAPVGLLMASGVGLWAANTVASTLSAQSASPPHRSHGQSSRRVPGPTQIHSPRSSSSVATAAASARSSPQLPLPPPQPLPNGTSFLFSIEEISPNYEIQAKKTTTHGFWLPPNRWDAFEPRNSGIFTPRSRLPAMEPRLVPMPRMEQVPRPGPLLRLHRTWHVQKQRIHSSGMTWQCLEPAIVLAKDQVPMMDPTVKHSEEAMTGLG